MAGGGITSLSCTLATAAVAAFFLSFRRLWAWSTKSICFCRLSLWRLCSRTCVSFCMAFLTPVSVFYCLLEQLKVPCCTLNSMLVEILTGRLIHFFHQEFFLQLTADFCWVHLLQCCLGMVPSSVGQNSLYPDWLALGQDLVNVVEDEEHHGWVCPEVSTIQEHQVPWHVAHLQPVLHPQQRLLPLLPSSVLQILIKVYLDGEYRFWGLFQNGVHHVQTVHQTVWTREWSPFYHVNHGPQDLCNNPHHHMDMVRQEGKGLDLRALLIVRVRLSQKQKSSPVRQRQMSLEIWLHLCDPLYLGGITLRADTLLGGAFLITGVGVPALGAMLALAPTFWWPFPLFAPRLSGGALFSVPLGPVCQLPGPPCPRPNWPLPLDRGTAMVAWGANWPAEVICKSL